MDKQFSSKDMGSNENGEPQMTGDLSEGPKRSFMDTPSIKWRLGHPPDYTRVNEQFMAERSRHHKAGSLEEIVENLVKTWEMEASHKLDPKQWESVDYDNYQVVVNGTHSFDIDEALRLGTYNMLMVDSPFYDAKNHTFESSHELFREAFKESFPWEVLEVISGPPKVVFTWRHWGKWSGDYEGISATGETVESFGMCIATVNDKLKIQKLEIYSDPNPFLLSFQKHSDTKCPFLRKSTKL